MAATTTKKPAAPEITAHVGGDSAGYITYDLPDDCPDGVVLPFPRPFLQGLPENDVLMVTPTSSTAAAVPFFVAVDDVRQEQGEAECHDIVLTGSVKAGAYSYAYHLRPAG